jgi:hypothetical protein
VINSDAVDVKATPLRGSARPSLDSHRTTAQTGRYWRGSGVVVRSNLCGDRVSLRVKPSLLFVVL